MPAHPDNVVVVLGLLTDNEVMRLEYEVLGGPVSECDLTREEPTI